IFENLLAVGYRIFWVNNFKDNPNYAAWEIQALVENDLIEKGYISPNDSYTITIRLYAGHGIWRGDCVFSKEPTRLSSNSTVNDLVIISVAGKSWGLIWYFDESVAITDVVYNPETYIE
ncbi:hypothetical protein ACFLUG_05020, partial [Chloroflexota bacterium]